MTESVDHNARGAGAASREGAGNLLKPIVFVGGCAGFAWFVSPPTESFGQFLFLWYISTVFGFVLICVALTDGIMPILNYLAAFALFHGVKVAAVVGIGLLFRESVAAGAVAGVAVLAALGLFYFRDA